MRRVVDSMIRLQRLSLTHGRSFQLMQMELIGVIITVINRTTPRNHSLNIISVPQFSFLTLHTVYEYCLAMCVCVRMCEKCGIFIKYSIFNRCIPNVSLILHFLYIMQLAVAQREFI